MKYLSFLIIFLSGNLFASERLPSLENKPTFETIQVNDTFLCIGREATGFDWANGRWAKHNFRPEKWILRKVAPETATCDLKDQSDYVNPDYAHLRRCYSYKKFSSTDKLGDSLNTAACYEVYTKDRKGYVQCTDFLFFQIAFEINGEYLRKTRSPFIPQKNATSVDSVVIETGSCSQM